MSIPVSCHVLTVKRLSPFFPCFRVICSANISGRKQLKCCNMLILFPPFRPDCEVAIREILNRTGGSCPLCPNRRWTWPADGSGTLDWQMLLHFSRTHKITDGLEFSFNKPNQVRVETSRPIHLITNGTVLKGNVDLILKKFNP